MIIWTRFGFLIPLLIIGTLMAMQLVVNAIAGNGYYTDHSKIFAPLAFYLSAGILYLLHKFWLAEKEKPKELLDPHTHKKIVLKRESSLFFIPWRYWPFIVLALGTLAFFI